MLTSVEIRNRANQSLTLYLDDEDREYFVQDIQGLDPVKAEFTSTGVAGTDDHQYQSATLGPRNVVILLGVQDIADKSIRTLRHELYSFFMPKSQITMFFYDDEQEVVQISGRVEDFDFPLFQRDPSATISIICHRPLFSSIEEETLSLSVPTTTGPLDHVISYEGTADTGLDLQLVVPNFTSLPEGFQLSMLRPDGVTQFMEINYAFTSIDIIKIGTNPGNKYVTLTRSGQEDSILYAMTYASDWVGLSPGANQLRFTVSKTGNPYPLTLKWTNRYGGL